MMLRFWPSEWDGRAHRCSAELPARTSWAERRPRPESDARSLCRRAASLLCCSPEPVREKHEPSAICKNTLICQQASQHHLPAADLQQGRVETCLQRRLHPLHQCPALQHLLLQRAVIIHVTDRVPSVTVGEWAVRSFSFQICMRLQRVWGKDSF